MKRLIAIVLLAVLAFGGFAGYTTAASITGPLDVRAGSQISLPQIGTITYSWGPVNSMYAMLYMDTVVSNPNDQDINLYSLNLKIYGNGIQLGTGGKMGSGKIPANGQTIMRLYARMVSSKFGEWFKSHIDSGNHTDLTITGLGIGRYGFLPVFYPINKAKSIDLNPLDYLSSSSSRSLSPFPLSIESTSAAWGTVTFTSAQVDFSAVVNNSSASAITVDALLAQLLARPVPVRGIAVDSILSNANIGNITLNPGNTNVNFTATVDTNLTARAIFTHIANRETSVVTLKTLMQEKLISSLPQDVRDFVFGNRADSLFLDFAGVSGLNIGGQVNTHSIQYLNQYWATPFTTP